MEQQPPPVDLNKLKKILSASKAIMNKVESNDYTTGHVDPRALNEEGVMEMQSTGVVRSASTAPVVPVGGFTEEQINNSRLPAAIKKAMLEHPIPQVTGFNTSFTLDDVSELQEKPMGHPKTPKTAPKAPQKQQLRESVNNDQDTITVSKDELKEMVNSIVNERLLEFFMKTSSQKITEDAVKKTLQMLIKEGKLTAKKKTI